MGKSGSGWKGQGRTREEGVFYLPTGGHQEAKGGFEQQRDLTRTRFWKIILAVTLELGQKDTALAQMRSDDSS